MKNQPKVLITGSCQKYKDNPAVTKATGNWILINKIFCLTFFFNFQ
jgi:hypothetical protein